MSGLTGYPRSYGTALPASVATALRKQGFIADCDVGLYEAHYISIEGPDFLCPNTSDSSNQPGAVDRNTVADQPPAKIVTLPSNLGEGWSNWLETLSSGDELTTALHTFQGMVNVELLPAGTKLYRVVGAVVPTSTDDWERMQAAPRCLVNYPAGSFWTFEDISLFNSEAEWRGRFAVKTEWNGDHGYVEYVLDEPHYGLVGLTKMQGSTDPNKVFPGGAAQVYVSKGACDPTKGGTLSLKSIIKAFPWSNGK